ncbi:MAG: rRNA pseudouridine synthase [Lachnospiraceae bacterium]|nr:rRNA pseudouridine synthase [Lachnospiraceae bacterium]
MRIDKFICDCLGVSRSEAKNLIKNGKVELNGSRVSSSDLKFDESKAEVFVNGEALTYEKYVYFMLNKPAGLVSATKDSAPTVIDLFKNENRKNLFPVGRLDKDTLGLLIVTDDGDLGHHLTSPKHHVDKTYRVTIRTPLSADDIKALESGLDIGEGEVSGPAKVTVVDEETILLTISEGKYHQVKRMLEAVGNKVLLLKRISIGGVTLDDNLKEGEYRRLTPSELDILNDNI